MLITTLIGNPNSSMLIYGSGVMTERADWSTRFPLRLQNIRHQFLFIRSENGAYGEIQTHTVFNKADKTVLTTP